MILHENITNTPYDNNIEVEPLTSARSAAQAGFFDVGIVWQVTAKSPDPAEDGAHGSSAGGYDLSFSQNDLGETISICSTFFSFSNSLSPVTKRSAFPDRAAARIIRSSLSLIATRGKAE